MSVQVQTEPAFTASVPRAVYSFKDLKVYGSTFAPDGRLLVVLQGEGEEVTRIDVVVNFFDDLRAKLAASGR